MWRGDNVRVGHQARVFGRLGLKHIQPGAPHLAALQGRDQVCLLEQLAAGAVHDAHPGLGESQRLGVEQVTGLRRRRRMQAQEVAFLQQLLEGHQVDALVLRQPGRNKGI